MSFFNITLNERKSRAISGAYLLHQSDSHTMWFTCDYHVTPCYSRILHACDSSWCIATLPHPVHSRNHSVYTRPFPSLRVGSGKSVQNMMQELALCCIIFVLTLIARQSNARIDSDSILAFLCIVFSQARCNACNARALRHIVNQAWALWIGVAFMRSNTEIFLLLAMAIANSVKCCRVD